MIRERSGPCGAAGEAGVYARGYEKKHRVVLESNTTDIGAIHGVDVRHLQRVQSILADNRLSIGIARDKHSAVFGGELQCEVGSVTSCG